MKIHIKNMVSLRCKIVVKDTLSSLKIPYSCVNLGEVSIVENDISDTKREELKKILKRYGLELMDEKKIYNSGENKEYNCRNGTLF